MIHVDYQSILGDAWYALDESVRIFLDTVPGTASATLTVGNGDWGPSRFLARCLRLPKAGKNVHVIVNRYTRGNREIWQRRFPDVTVVSEQWVEDGLLLEQVGIVICRFRLRVGDGTLMFQHHSTMVSVFGVRLSIPRMIAPIVQAFHESSEAPTSTFVHVSLWLPIVRIVLTYSGVVQQK